MGGYVDDQAVQWQFFIISLKPIGVFPQAAEVGLDDISDFLLCEGLLIEPPLGDLVLEGVVILSLEDEEVDFLVGAISFVIDVVVMFECGDGLAFGVLVFGEYVL